MKNILIVIIGLILVIGVGCKPKIPNHAKEEVPTIELSEPPETTSVATPSDITTTPAVQYEAEIVAEVPEGAVNISITDEELTISAPNFTGTHREKVRTLTLRLKADGSVDYIKVNETDYFAGGTHQTTYHINHSYTYQSPSCVKVQKGNTLDALAQDHNTTRQAIINCNPFLNARTNYRLREGDIVCLNCNCGCSQ